MGLGTRDIANAANTSTGIASGLSAQVAPGRPVGEGIGGPGLSYSTEGGGIGPPVASNVTFTGTLAVGYILLGSYTYTDPQGLPESGSTYQWYRADDDAGTNAEPISGATALTYMLAEADGGKHIRFGVTPSNGSVAGEEAFSAWTEESVQVPNPLWPYTVFQSSFTGENGGTTFADDTGRHTVSSVISGATTSTAKSNSPPSSLKQGRVIFGDNISDFAFGTGDFTIQMFVNLNASEVAGTPISMLFGTWYLVRDFRAIGPPFGNSLRLQGTSSSDVIINAQPISTPFDEWVYWEISRIGTTISMYQNETRIAQVTSSYSFANSSALNLNPDRNNSFYDDIRILKGIGLNSGPTCEIPSTPFPGEFLS